MLIKIQLVGCAIALLCFASILVYSFNRCGWGMFAYENAFIAALTQECAQQQRELFLQEQLQVAPVTQ